MKFRVLTLLFALSVPGPLLAQPSPLSFTKYQTPNIAFSLTTGPDGALWFVETTDNRTIGRITTAGAVTEFVAPNTPAGLAAGPDGAVWFTEFYARQIGRITTSGEITEYPLPCCGRPSSITLGPDRALWFGESGSNRMGRITTAGVVTDFPLPDPSSEVVAITTGPDGASGLLNWFPVSIVSGA